MLYYLFTYLDQAYDIPGALVYFSTSRSEPQWQ
jgi:hypothetical protein